MIGCMAAEPSARHTRDRLAAIISLQTELLRVSSDADAVMALSCARSEKLCSADGSIFWENTDGRQVVRHAHGLGEQLLGSGVPVTESLAGAALQEGRPVISGDAPNDPRVSQEMLAKAPGCRSLLVVPLMHEAPVPGAMTLLSRRSNAFDDSDVIDMQLVAAAVVGALNLARRFAAEAEVREAQRQLEEHVASLREAHDQRRRLLQTLVEAQEAERAQIAADIHDDSVQVMAAAALRLATIRQFVTDEGLLQRLDTLEETINRATARLRKLLFDLRPRALDAGGLAGAVQEFVEGTFEPPIDVEVLDRMEEEPPRDARVTLYRIAQEAITNVRKHAHAQHLRISFDTRDQGTQVCIEDDGIGFDLESALQTQQTGHVGLISMRERAQTFGGWWRCAPGESGGTVVEFWVPA